jgi:hypothetical protein
MQCVDCHNRPTHTFELPGNGVDKALARGEIPVSLPYFKKQSVQILKASYASNAEASARFRRVNDSIAKSPRYFSSEVVTRSAGLRWLRFTTATFSRI